MIQRNWNMLESKIILYLVQCEAISNLRQGRVLGFTLSHFMSDFGVPRATMYRAINDAIDAGVIVRTGRGRYALSHDMRQACNLVPDSNMVTS